MSPKFKYINLSLSKLIIFSAQFTHIYIYMQSIKQNLGKNDSFFYRYLSIFVYLCQETFFFNFGRINDSIALLCIFDVFFSLTSNFLQCLEFKQFTETLRVVILEHAAMRSYSFLFCLSFPSN